MWTRLVFGALLALAGLFFWTSAQGEDPQNSVGIITLVIGAAVVCRSLIVIAQAADHRNQANR